jgi:hypothetical protein
MVLIWLAVLSLPALAQQAYQLGSDQYKGGRNAYLGEVGRDDVLLTGLRATVAAPITGTAHMVGRWVQVDGALGADLYALGQRVSVDAPVAGDVSVIAQQLQLSAPVGGDLRATGSEVQLNSDVAGNALISVEMAQINGVISGDLVLNATEVSFGPQGRVSGRLVIYEDEPGQFPVPVHVASGDQIDRLARSDAPWAPDFYAHRAKQEAKAERKAREKARREGQWSHILPMQFISWVLGLSAVVWLLAQLRPGLCEDLSAEMLEQPIGSLLWGAQALAGLIGACVLLCFSWLGIFLVPPLVFVLLITALIGLVIGALVLGQGLWKRLRRDLPGSALSRAGAAFVGSLLTLGLFYVPALGSLLVIAVACLGVGVIAIRVFQPRIFAP